MTKEERQAKYKELADCLNKASGIMQELKANRFDYDDYVISASIALEPFKNIWEVPNDKRVTILLGGSVKDFPYSEEHEINNKYFKQLHTKVIGDCLFYTYGGSKDGQ